MPIYEYKCRKKGHIFEVFLKASEKAPLRCVKCSSGVDRLMSKTSFQLKGSGWYVTDYAAKSSGKDSKSAPELSAETPKGSESKPAKPKKASAKGKAE